MIDREDIDGLKDHFVTKDECAHHRSKTAERFESISVSLTEIRTQQKIETAILGTIGAAVIAIVVKIFLGG